MSRSSEDRLVNEVMRTCGRNARAARQLARECDEAGLPSQAVLARAISRDLGQLVHSLEGDTQPYGKPPEAPPSGTEYRRTPKGPGDD